MTLFEKGQHTNNLRAAYQDFISDGGVSATKSHKIVNIVLTKKQDFMLTDCQNKLTPRIWQST